MFNNQSTKTMYNSFYLFKTTISKFFIKTPFQHAFNSSVWLHLTVRAEAAILSCSHRRKIIAGLERYISEICTHLLSTYKHEVG